MVRNVPDLQYLASCVLTSAGNEEVLSAGWGSLRVRDLEVSENRAYSVRNRVSVGE